MFLAGYTAAAIAALSDVATLRVLAERGADLNCSNTKCGTLLQAAVCANRLSTVKYLQAESDLFKRVHLDRHLASTLTALHMACGFGKPQLVRCVQLYQATASLD